MEEYSKYGYSKKEERIIVFMVRDRLQTIGYSKTFKCLFYFIYSM